MRARATAALSARPGVRAGLLVLAASSVGHVGNYLYYVVAARMTGPVQFAEISALIAYATIAFMPFNGMQVAAARDVARLRSAGDAAGLSCYLRSLLRRVAVVVAALGAVALAASPLLARWLRLESVGLAALAAGWIVLGTALLIGTGIAQGQESFQRVAAVLAGPLGILRCLFLPVLLVVAGLAGSMLAMIAAATVGLALVYRPVRDGLAAAPAGDARFRPGRTVVALLAFSSLTNLDLLVAKASLDAADAGRYSGAVLLAKIALFAPAALAMVLLPRAAARLERGQDADRQVLLTLGVTLASGLAVAAVLVLPADFLGITFGADFTAAAPLLGPLALVMTAAAVLNVHLTFAVARGGRAFSSLLVTAAIGHAALLTVLHGSAPQIVVAGAVSVGGALAVHELTSRHGAVRMLARLRHREA